MQEPTLDEPTVTTGLEVLLQEELGWLNGMRVGLVCHPASVDARLRHAVDRLIGAGVRLTALFGPQHGIRGETQDNMIEWEGYSDPRLGLPVFSLYGRRREPDRKSLAEVDAMLFDLQDVGARYYTFVWTMAMTMRTCARAGKTFAVLDRPNPINGLDVEGNMPEAGFLSFVGLYPLPARHGMTIAELALYLNDVFELGCHLKVIPMRGWKREQFFDDTGLPWVMPSPNMPTIDTALTYPGMCLFEGTNVSEGRGTTRPFELLGAPWIDPEALTDRLAAASLPGVAFRPLRFQPTFNKWKDQSIGGLQLHITDRRAFLPFRTGLVLLKEYRDLSGDRFAWKQPPYEYEFLKLPIDILCGTDRIRMAIEAGKSVDAIEATWQDDLDEFRRSREKYLLY